MFTGLIEACVPVREWQRRGSGGRLLLAPLGGEALELGESISVSGCCLTVAEHGAQGIAFDLAAETLARTWFAELAPGRRVNVERALRFSDRLGGHLVSGHVDATGSIVAVEDSGDGGKRMRFEVPASFARYLIDKGSVTIDGVSLTVVSPRERLFDVALIPVTLAETSLGSARVGERVNLEADLIGKWVERLVASR